MEDHLLARHEPGAISTADEKGRTPTRFKELDELARKDETPEERTYTTSAGLSCAGESDPGHPAASHRRPRGSP